MTTPKQLQTATWLNKQGLLSLAVGVGEHEFTELQKLLGNPGFGYFWALLANLRAECAVMLANSTLGTPERDTAAAVIQGRIRCIDGIRELLLNIADPSEVMAETPKQELNNGR